jgi:hypothetical protein
VDEIVVVIDEPGGQISVTVTETMISIPIAETEGTLGVTYGGGGVVTGNGTEVAVPLLYPVGLTDGIGPDG